MEQTVSEKTEIISAEAEALSADRKLRKSLTFTELLFLSIGAIIGSGWLFAVLAAAKVSGPSVIFSWIIAGILVLFIALNYAEISGMMPRSGAIVRYPHYSHGSYTGYILGWTYFLSAVSVPTIEAEAVVGYAATYLPWLTRSESTLLGSVKLLTPAGIGLGVVLMIIFFLVNWFGIRFMGKFNKYIVWWKLVIPILTFLLLFAAFNGSNFTAYGGFFPRGSAAMFLAIPTSGIIFAYLGFRQALDYGGEGKNPKKDVPRATVLSIVITTIIYFFLQLAFIGAIKWGNAGIPAGSWSILDTSTWASGPLYHALSASGISLLGAFATILLIDAWISPSGTGWIYMGTTTRTLYGMSTDGYYPKAFRKIHEKTRIPWIALIVSLAIGLIFLAPFPSWYLLVGFISGATVFTYIMGGVVLRVLRRTAPSIHRVYRLKGSSILAPIAFASAALIVYWSGSTLVTILTYVIFIGLPFYLIFYGPRHLKLPQKLFTAIGIIFWIILGILIAETFNLVIDPTVAALNMGKAAPAAVFMWFPVMVIITGLLVFITTAVVHKFTTPEKRNHIKAGYWLLAFIFGTWIISFYGAFGPYLSTSAAPLYFPWDNVVYIIFALIMFYLAVKSGFRTEDIVTIEKEETARNTSKEPT